MRVPGNRNFCGCSGPVVGRPERAERRLPRRIQLAGAIGEFALVDHAGPLHLIHAGAPFVRPSLSLPDPPDLMRPRETVRAQADARSALAAFLGRNSALRRGYLVHECGISSHGAVTGPRRMRGIHTRFSAVDAASRMILVLPRGQGSVTRQPSAHRDAGRVRLWTKRVDNFMICGQVGPCSGQTGGWRKNLEISGQRVLCDAALLA